MEGINNNIENNIDSVITKENNFYALKDAILKTNADMGKYGYIKAMEKFDMKKNVEKIIRIYGEIK